MDTFFLNLFGRTVQIDSNDRSLSSFIVGCYSAFLIEGRPPNVDLSLEFRQQNDSDAWTLSYWDSSVNGNGLAYAVFTLEKVLTIELQKIIFGTSIM